MIKNFRRLFIVMSILIGVFALYWTFDSELSGTQKAAQSVDPEARVPSKSVRSSVPGRLKSFGLGDSQLVRGESNTLKLKRHSTVSLTEGAAKMFQKPLFKIKNKPLGELSMTAHTSSAIELKYQNGMLQEFLAENATSLMIPLEEGVEVEARIEEVVYRGEQTVTLRGQIGDDAMSEALIVFHDGAVSGSIAFYATNEHYEMGLSGDGHIAVRKLDPESYHEGCACHQDGAADEIDEMADEMVGVEEELDEALFSQEVAESAADTDESNSVSGEVSSDEVAEDVIDHSVDSVMGYDSGSRIAEGGVAGIEAKIILAVDRVNTVFQNSGIDNTEMVLLGMVEDPDYIFPGNSATSMSSSDELGDLESETDDSLDIISDLRIELGADHQGFIIEGTNSSAGVAFRPGKSMIVSTTAMNSVSLTFVHELGHNIGCRHAWGDTDNNDSGSNYGWRFVSNGAGYRTVMAYQGDTDSTGAITSWTRVPYFSTLFTTFEGTSNGTAMGAVDGYNASGDGSVDQGLVSDVDIFGTTHAGFDGSNSDLGARNAEYITANSQFLADNFDRPEIAAIRVAGSSGVWLSSGESELDFSSISVGENVSQVLTVSNVGGVNLTGVSLNITGASSANFTISSIPGTLIPYESVSVTVTHTSVSSGSFSGALEIGSNDADDPSFTVSLTGSVREELSDIGDSFESGLGSWTPSSGNDFNWERDTGGTPSSDTGPDSGDQSSWYIYTEASGENSPGKTAGIEKEFDFSDFTDVVFQFSYHMFGAGVGQLHMDVFDGSWNESVWSINGSQQNSSSDAWSTAVVNLSSYVDGESGVIIRFRGVTGSDFRGDMAVDEIKILAISSSGFLEDWYAEYGLSGEDATPLATPEQDGVTNLEKYAFNLDPTEPASYTVAFDDDDASGLPLTRLVEDGGDQVLEVEYIRRKGNSGITYEVLFGDYPGVGDGLNYDEDVTNIDTTWERVIATDPRTTATKDRRFGTVRVSIAE